MKRFTAGLLACSVASTAFAWSDTERGLRDSTTTALIIQMQSEFRKCFEIPWVYRYDCYDDAYFSSARRVADNPDYDLVEDTLAEVGDKIQAVVRANADPVKPPLRKGFKSYQPIKEEARATAKAQVADAIEEAEEKTTKAIGEIKQKKGLPIRDFTVEVQVLKRARERARQVGLDERVA